MPEDLGYRSPEWLAEQLDIDKSTVYRFLNEGKLPALQLGKKWLINESELRGFLRTEQLQQTERRQIEAWAVRALERGGWDVDEDNVDRVVKDVYEAAERGKHQLPNALGKDIELTKCPSCKKPHNFVVQYVYRPQVDERYTEWAVASTCSC